MRREVQILWREGELEGEIQVSNGEFVHYIIPDRSPNETPLFKIENRTPSKLIVSLKDNASGNSNKPTIVTIKTNVHTFSFFLRDVRKDYPICIPAYGVIVTESTDNRTYEQIAAATIGNGKRKLLQQLAADPEESYAQAAVHTLNLPCQTWLGLSRDFRLFAVGYHGVGAGNLQERLWDWIQPRFHGSEITLPENENKQTGYQYMIGRGVGCVRNINRRLDKGYLPILHADIVDDEILYQMTSFVSYEKSELNRDTLRGTHYLLADGYGMGHMFTEEQQKKFDRLVDEQWEQPEETVLYCRIEAVNQGVVPRYAWFKNPVPNGHIYSVGVKYAYDAQKGFAKFESGRVFCVSKLNGAPLPFEENAVLIAPGEQVVFEFYVPHSPVEESSGELIFQQDFQERLEQCRVFWEDKLASAAHVELPEKRLEEMFKAGLLHLDMVAYGLEKDDTIVPTIGIYTAIGSESAPIVQFMDSAGWSNEARRANQFFLDKQHDSGFIQNFGGYMLETGAALWSIGEHYRYTQNVDWIREQKENIVKACEYIRQWRGRNLKDEFIGRGYGMLEGKVADPEDPYHSFMLNGYAYLGLKRAAEMLEAIDPESVRWISNEAALLKQNILDALNEEIGKSPVVPLGDGSWCPTAPPWVEYRGPLSLFAEGENWFNHGTVVARDSMLGANWLVVQEVLDADDPIVDFLIDYHSELMYTRQVAFSQPYYSPHPFIHLKRQEVNAFLKAFYNGFAGLADRETYTFWEHYWHASPHKTHEEGWFLMQLRWMLYMEDFHARSLRLLPGIPRQWLEDGKEIKLHGLKSYFGEVQLDVKSEIEQGRILAEIKCSGQQAPETVHLRLPHPLHKIPRHVEGGKYVPETETVMIHPFSGHTKIEVHF